MSKTNYLQAVISDLQRTAGPYRCATSGCEQPQQKQSHYSITSSASAKQHKPAGTECEPVIVLDNRDVMPLPLFAPASAQIAAEPSLQASRSPLLLNLCHWLAK